MKFYRSMLLHPRYVVELREPQWAYTAHVLLSGLSLLNVAILAGIPTLGASLTSQPLQLLLCWLQTLIIHSRAPHNYFDPMKYHLASKIFLWNLDDPPNFCIAKPVSCGHHQGLLPALGSPLTVPRQLNMMKTIMRSQLPESGGGG